MSNTLKDRILACDTDFLFYGLTPPKSSTDDEKIRSIAAKQMARITRMNIDALILYDLQDESVRNSSPRPFPFMATLQPDFYSDNYLSGINVPCIIYKSVGKYKPDKFADWLQNATNNVSVFVGSPSVLQATNMSLRDAYRIKNEVNSQMVVGGVTIPERHHIKGDEHLRLFNKIDSGCRFFVSQCVYSLDNSMDFLSDYYYTSRQMQRRLVPIIFTLSPCGSLKTLDFMRWLGIDVPHWLDNELKYSDDILLRSVEACKNVAVEIYGFCKEKSIPVGFNIESVAVRKEEIEASVELVRSVAQMMNK